MARTVRLRQKAFVDKLHADFDRLGQRVRNDLHSHLGVLREVGGWRRRADGLLRDFGEDQRSTEAWFGLLAAEKSESVIGVGQGLSKQLDAVAVRLRDSVSRFLGGIRLSPSQGMSAEQFLGVPSFEHEDPFTSGKPVTPDQSASKMRPTHLRLSDSLLKAATSAQRQNSTESIIEQNRTDNQLSFLAVGALGRIGGPTEQANPAVNHEQSNFFGEDNDRLSNFNEELEGFQKSKARTLPGPTDLWLEKAPLDVPQKNSSGGGKTLSLVGASRKTQLQPSSGFPCDFLPEFPVLQNKSQSSNIYEQQSLRQQFSRTNRLKDGPEWSPQSRGPSLLRTDREDDLLNDQESPVPELAERRRAAELHSRVQHQRSSLSNNIYVQGDLSDNPLSNRERDHVGLLKFDFVRTQRSNTLNNEGHFRPFRRSDQQSPSSRTRNALDNQPHQTGVTDHPSPADPARVLADKQPNRSTDASRKPKLEALSGKPGRENVLRHLVNSKFGNLLRELAHNKLISLDLNNAELKDAHLPRLCEMIGKASNLRYLKLSKNRISDFGVPALAECILQTNVESLDLSENDLSIRTARLLLSAFQRSPSKLRSINLRRNKIESKNRQRLVFEFRSLGINLEV